MRWSSADCAHHYLAVVGFLRTIFSGMRGDQSGCRMLEASSEHEHLSLGVHPLLILASDVGLREVLEEQLQEKEGFWSVSLDTSGTSLPELVGKCTTLCAHRSVAAILVEMPMSGIPTRDVCTTLKSLFPHTALLLLTPIASYTETLEGLTAGADDAICKPPRVGTVVARLRNAIAETQNRKPLQRIGGWIFRPLERRLVPGCDRGVPVVLLTRKECQILSCLLDKKEAVVRSELLREIWRYNQGVETFTVESHIYRLRRKLHRACGYEILRSTSAGYLLCWDSLHTDRT